MLVMPCTTDGAGGYAPWRRPRRWLAPVSGTSVRLQVGGMTVMRDNWRKPGE
jgi:hypothetical protein